LQKTISKQTIKTFVFFSIIILLVILYQFNRSDLLIKYFQVNLSFFASIIFITTLPSFYLYYVLFSENSLLKKNTTNKKIPLSFWIIHFYTIALYLIFFKNPNILELSYKISLDLFSWNYFVSFLSGIISYFGISIFFYYLLMIFLEKKNTSTKKYINVNKSQFFFLKVFILIEIIYLLYLSSLFSLIFDIFGYSYFN